MLVGFTLIAIYVLLATALAVIVWSVFHRLRCCRGEAVQNNIPVRRIAWCAVFLLIALLVISAFTASTQPILINGKPYTDTFWLLASDMFISTSVWLILIATAIVAISSLYRIIKSKAKSL